MRGLGPCRHAARSPSCPRPILLVSRAPPEDASLQHVPTSPNQCSGTNAHAPRHIRTHKHAQPRQNAGADTPLPSEGYVATGKVGWQPTLAQASNRAILRIMASGSNKLSPSGSPPPGAGATRQRMALHAWATRRIVVTCVQVDMVSKCSSRLHARLLADVIVPYARGYFALPVATSCSPAVVLPETTLVSACLGIEATQRHGWPAVPCPFAGQVASAGTHLATVLRPRHGLIPLTALLWCLVAARLPVVPHRATHVRSSTRNAAWTTLPS